MKCSKTYLLGTLMLAVLLVFQLSGVFAAGQRQETAAVDPLDEWMQVAQVGPYQPEVEDWDAIAEAARNEPPALVYSNTSRIFRVLDAFNEMYGVTVEALNISSAPLVERLRIEYDSGIHDVDVILYGSVPRSYNQLIQQRQALIHYAPRELEAKLQPVDLVPTLMHRYEVATWYYKTDRPDGSPPYDNIWELTEDHFRNRVVWRSPLDSGTVLDVMVAIVANAEKMEALYEEYYGRPITLTTENAGYEWIKRVLDNDSRIVVSHADVAEAVTNARAPFVGLGSQSVYRGVFEGEYDFDIDLSVNPSVLTLRPIAMGAYSKSPNTAKLLIKYLTSQEGGDPWWGADFPVDPDIVGTGFMADLRLSDFQEVWHTDIDLALILSEDVADFWLINE